MSLRPYSRVIISLAIVAWSALVLADSPARAAEQVRVNFGKLDVEGWVTESGGAYDPQRGFGWLDELHRSQCFNRSSDLGIRDTVCRAESRWYDKQWRFSPAVKWRIDVPNGRYLVTVGWGDSALSTLNRIEANGVVVVDGDNGRMNLESAAAVDVADGSLVLTFGDSAEYQTAINYLSLDLVEPAPPAEPPVSTTTTTAIASSTTTSTTSTVPLLTTTTEPQTSSTTVPAPMEPTGDLQLPPGVFEVDDPIVIGDHQALTGAGVGVTIIRPGAGFDPSEGPIVRTAVMDGDGNHHFSIADLTIDCMEICEGVRIHGYQYDIDNLTVSHATGSGFHTSWKPDDWGEAAQPDPATDAFIMDLQVQQSGSPTEPAVLLDGPHDLVLTNLFVSTHEWVPDDQLLPAAIQIGPGGFGTIITNGHYWGRDHLRGIVVDEGVTGVRLDGYWEGARLAEVTLVGANRDAAVTGQVRCFGHDFAPEVRGVLLGPDTSGIRVDLQMSNCLAGGLVFETPSSGLVSILDIVSWESPVVGPIPQSALLRLAF
ncbi:MAG: hypothetical protein R2770_13975 [Acidimicrobiales bacterium]